MIKAEIFKKYVEEYYNHLTDRFEKGSNYVDNNPDDAKAYELYLEIIQEMKLVQSLINFYENKGDL